VTGGLRQPRVDEDFPVLTDGVVVLRCLSRDDAAQHLAGEDDEQIRWVSGGPGSMDRLPYWIDSNREQWRTGGPRRHFGGRDAHTDALVGNVEANLRLDGSAARRSGFLRRDGGYPSRAGKCPLA
jgi:hypothetical protein